MNPEPCQMSVQQHRQDPFMKRRGNDTRLKKPGFPEIPETLSRGFRDQEPVNPEAEIPGIPGNF